MKRLFDILVSGVGLILLFPVFLVVGVFILLDSPGPVFFLQERMGRNFRPFFILKFRTMVPDASRRGGIITGGDDPRITRVGKYLRNAKLDELPQLINVLKGEMSLVGPRPEVRRYVEFFRTDYEEILRVRPGITDLASVKYRNEAELLGSGENVEEVYLTSVLPDKIQQAKEYLQHSSLTFDISVIVNTVRALFRPRPIP